MKRLVFRFLIIVTAMLTSVMGTVEAQSSDTPDSTSTWQSFFTFQDCEGRALCLTEPILSRDESDFVQVFLDPQAPELRSPLWYVVNSKGDIIMAVGTASEDSWERVEAISSIPDARPLFPPDKVGWVNSHTVYAYWDNLPEPYIRDVQVRYMPGYDNVLYMCQDTVEPTVPWNC